MPIRTTALAIATTSVMLFAGCGNVGESPPVQVVVKSDEVESRSTGKPAGADNPAPKPITATGTFMGVVRFNGKPPDRKLIFRKDDPDVKDCAVCAAEDYSSEELLVNENADNGVANVIIYLKEPPKGYVMPPVPTEPVNFLTIGCRYVPHVLVFRCNQTVLVKSDDPVPHNTHHRPLRNTEFGRIIAPPSREGNPEKFSKPESMPMWVDCDLHRWMRAYWLPLEHPFAAVTDADGKFEIKGLPPGKHSFIVWHEMPGYLNKALDVDVKADGVRERNLAYRLSDFVKKP